MKWIFLAVLLNGATGSLHDAVIDMNVDKYPTYERCATEALAFQERAAIDPAMPSVKIYCWRVDTENSGSLAAGFEPAKNNADTLLPKR